MAEEKCPITNVEQANCTNCIYFTKQISDELWCWNIDALALKANVSFPFCSKGAWIVQLKDYVAIYNLIGVYSRLICEKYDTEEDNDD